MIQSCTQYTNIEQSEKELKYFIYKMHFMTIQFLFGKLLSPKKAHQEIKREYVYYFNN